MPTPMSRSALLEFTDELTRLLRAKGVGNRSKNALRLVRSRVVAFHPEVAPRAVTAILRRTIHTKAYRCHLTARGAFGCVMLDLARGTSRRCGSLQRTGFCQHVVAMVLMLVRRGLMTRERALRWSRASPRLEATVDREGAVQDCLRKLQAEAPEFDWRPGALIAEDLYAHIGSAAHAAHAARAARLSHALVSAAF